MDVFLAFPLLLFAIALVGVIPDVRVRPAAATRCGSALLIFIIGFFSWPYIGRIVRGQTLSLREREFVDAARSLGARGPYILFRELLPNLVGADPGLLDAADPDEHPVRGGAVLPRRRRPARRRRPGAACSPTRSTWYYGRPACS